MSSDRFGGIESSLEVAGVCGIEFGVRQSFCHGFCLESPCLCERHVEMALGFVVDVALRLAVANQE